MKDLIERLEKATGPSNKLDVAIWEAIFVSPETFRRVPPPRYTEWQKNDDGVWRDYYADLNAKPYTASIDAALTLVPEGFYWSTDSRGCTIVGSEYPPPEADVCSICTNQRNPAIALCIAALKARSALPSPDAK